MKIIEENNIDTNIHLLLLLLYTTLSIKYANV